MIEHLVGRAAFATRRPPQRLHIVGVQIRDAPAADLARGHQPLHRLDRLLQRDIPAPVQEIHIEIVGLQPAQAVFTGAAHRRSAGVPGIDFGHQHHAIAQAADRLPDDLFRPTVGIHFRRIDHRQSVVDARAQCSHFLRTLRRIFAHIPGAQPDGRNRRLLAKAYCFFHRLLLFSFLHHHKAKQGVKPCFDA